MVVEGASCYLRERSLLATLTKPWALVLLDSWGGAQVVARFLSFNAAVEHGRVLQGGAYSRKVSVSHVDDGADLIRFETQINRLRDEQNATAARLHQVLQGECDLAEPGELRQRIKDIEEMILAVHDQAFMYAELRGWELHVGLRDGRVRLWIDGQQPGGGDAVSAA